MPNSESSEQIFLSYSHTHDRFLYSNTSYHRLVFGYNILTYYISLHAQ